jgi:hypothetical protein
MFLHPLDDLLRKILLQITAFEVELAGVDWQAVRPPVGEAGGDHPQLNSMGIQIAEGQWLLGWLAGEVV